MNKLRLSPEAAAELKSIQTYIAKSLQNPIAAQNVMKRITDGIRVLEQYAQAGFPISARTGIDTGLRILVCGVYLAVYRVQDDVVSVARVINGRQDYITELFGKDIVPDRVDLAKSLIGIIPPDISTEEARDERLNKI